MIWSYSIYFLLVYIYHCTCYVILRSWVYFRSKLCCIILIYCLWIGVRSSWEKYTSLPSTYTTHTLGRSSPHCHSLSQHPTVHHPRKWYDIPRALNFNYKTHTHTYLRVFECSCYPHLTTDHKLVPWTTPCLPLVSFES